LRANADVRRQELSTDQLPKGEKLSVQQLRLQNTVLLFHCCSARYSDGPSQNPCSWISTGPKCIKSRISGVKRTVSECYVRVDNCEDYCWLRR